MTGFRRGTEAWYYQEAEPDTATAFAVHNARPVNQRWDQSFRYIIAEAATPTGEPIWYTEILHVDGPPMDGTFERALFGVVIDPQRVEDCDARHRNLPEALRSALIEAGFRNFSAFRRGGHVMYYGECYPRLRVALASLAATGLLSEWLEGLRGVVTRITEDGNPIVAREMFHQD